jgi:outer membrane protein assembly factor BamD
MVKMASLSRFCDSLARLLSHPLARLRWLVLAGAVLAACSSTGEEKFDETRNWSAERLYREGKSELTGGGYKKAIDYYQKLQARYPYGKYAQQAQLELTYALYKDQEPVLALAEADRFVKLYPDNSNVDYAYYLKGLINFNEDLGIFGGISNQDMSERDPKAAVESFEAFRDLVTRFPDSRYTPDAYARMKYLVNALAFNEVHVADYYLRRKAYIAAVNRAQFVVNNYPKTPAVEASLAIMVRAYDAMGLTDLRDDTHRLLTLNFPNSKLTASTASLAGRQERKWWQFW